MSNEKPAAFEERYKALNKEQKRAVDATEGPVLVVAGPGTGKTELISLRVGKILKNGTARASNILCLTFTETAAANMRDRLEQFIGPDAFRVAIYTFHGFCTEMMGRYPEYFYSAARMSAASDLRQSEILESIFARLPHKHPLSAYHPEMGYSFLKESQARIKDIKKGGLTPSRFREIIEENKNIFSDINAVLAEHMPQRIGKESAKDFEKLVFGLEKKGGTLAQSYAGSLKRALLEGSTTALSAWKAKYTTKDEQGNRVFKDSIATQKLLALADIYALYQEALYKGGHFDYEDMIIEVVEELKKNATLRAMLEEQYQYIMVDEFQDTNNAQLSLVKALSSSEIHEGHANVCVVGDDDQAVYKFQGAEISNIHSFKSLYKDVEVIVLTENYRSSQDVLDFARSIVSQGVERLENMDKKIRKDLVAKNKNLPKGNICVREFATEEEEYSYIAEEVKKVLDQGESAKEIALIARNHKQLRALLPYLDALFVPYTYVREENVFDEQHVRELIVLCRYLGELGGSGDNDALLPEILSFPFWGLERVFVWEIAEQARRENSSWLSTMQKSAHKEIRQIAEFLIELKVLAKTVPLEIILDILIGSRDVPEVADSPDDDVYDRNGPILLKTAFSSPYKEFYFGKEIYKKNPSSYVSFLSSLRVFIRSLREYKEGEMLRAGDVGPFVDMHIDYNIALINNTPFAHNESAVSLLTSHGAKGLEFAYVFVVSANDSIWAGRTKGSKLSFPANLPLSQSPDDEDDFIRLFYVALTRARHSLFITHHESPFRFLLNENVPMRDKAKLSMDGSSLLATGLKVYHVPPFAHDEKALLKKIVEGYQLSPTHLDNFLNIVDGGPMKFLEQNLLRFPQAKSKSSVYGTAVHKALEDLYKQTKQEGKVAPLSFVLESFRKELKRGRLLDYEETKERERGEAALASYYKLHASSIAPKSHVELDFSKQSVVIDGARFTGKIDRAIEGDKGALVVVDLKTGKGAESWDEKGTLHEKLRLHKYRHQLMMYKLLVEHARDYEKHKVTEGVLEFVEEEIDGKIHTLPLSFDDKGIKEELEQFKKLAVAVYHKIINLDFPETSKYPQTYEGILQFEEDLISGKM